MTLIVTASHPAFAVMVADRRITIALSDGTTVLKDDDFGKLGYLLSADAAVLYGITGLAYTESRSFDTMSWIRDTLYGAPDLRFGALIRHLATSATHAVSSDALRNVKNRRLTIVFTGFYASGDPVSALVSNFEVNRPPEGSLFDNEFCEIIWRGSDRTNNSSGVQFQGAHHAVSTETIFSLNNLLLTGKPLAAVRGKAERIILDAADRPEANGTIGKRLISSYVLPPDGTTFPQPFCEYITDVPSPSISGIDTLVLAEQIRFATRDLKISLDDDSPIAFPRQQRNALCACGSGRKFKKCHGR
jgi:hypothetical protein